MKKITFTFLFVLLTQVVFSQSRPFYVDYTWENDPVYAVNSETSEEILELKNKIVTEFHFDKDGSLGEYFLEHRVLWLNSDPQIERFNKIYLPYSGDSKLEVSKARVINSKGSVLVLDDSDILTAEDEETGKQYKYFAFEGLEKGSFIEYYYVVKRNPRYNGNRLYLQSSIDKKNVQFDLFAPENLVFEFKSYNGIPAVSMDTLTTGKLHWNLHLQDLQKLEEEEQSAYNASRAFIVYKLDRNLANSARDISSYGGIAQNIHSFYYPEFSKKTVKRIRKFTSEAISKRAKGEEEIVRELEFFIKNNVYLSEGNSEELSDLDEVLKNKVANETGFMKLYAALLKTLDIKHEIVLTSDRQELKFDKEFEATNFLTDFLIYFPKSDKFISPTERASRFGFPPPYFTDNYGLFIKEVTVGTLTSGVAKIQYIEPVGAEKTFDEMTIDVSFDTEDISNTRVKLDRSMNGYYAMYIHPFIHLVKEKDKIELIESFARNLDEGAEILQKEIKNADPELFGIEPLQFVIDFKSDAFIEKAGDKYLFKVGELIGRQIELYQEKERVLPLENEFQRSYFRKININLPSGYTVSNPEDLEIKNVFSEEGKDLLSFHSYYELNGNTLTITADEHYRINIVDTENYENYRTVINSAADFNKISLVLEPVGN